MEIARAGALGQTTVRFRAKSDFDGSSHLFMSKHKCICQLDHHIINLMKQLIVHQVRAR